MTTSTTFMPLPAVLATAQAIGVTREDVHGSVPFYFHSGLLRLTSAAHAAAQRGLKVSPNR